MKKDSMEAGRLNSRGFQFTTTPKTTGTGIQRVLGGEGNNSALENSSESFMGIFVRNYCRSKIHLKGLTFPIPEAFRRMEGPLKIEVCESRGFLHEPRKGVKSSSLKVRGRADREGQS